MTQYEYRKNDRNRLVFFEVEIQDQLYITRTGYCPEDHPA